MYNMTILNSGLLRGDHLILGEGGGWEILSGQIIYLFSARAWPENLYQGQKTPFIRPHLHT